MNIGLFGGTFDPIHRGHLALARAARDRCKLSRVLFVPANIPPHKQTQPLSAFTHRYAMIALATKEEKDFSPSLLEAPEETESSGGSRKKNRAENEKEKPNYTIDTVKRLKQSFKKVDQLFLLIGIDPRNCFASVIFWWRAGRAFHSLTWPMRCPRGCVRGRK